MKTKTFKHFLHEQHYGSLVNKNKHDNMDLADQQLYKYTADGFTALGGVIDELVERYPYDGGTLYRGLHFDEQHQHDVFMKKISDGSLEFGSPTSWTPNLSTAKDFAHSKKSYFPTPELMKADRKMRDDGDHMTGYGGIVLKTKVGKGIGCDVNKTDYAKETEVILPASTYDISVAELIEPYARKYDTPEKVNDILKQLSKASVATPELRKLADYIENSWLKKLDPKQVDILIKYNNLKVFSLDDDKLRADCIRFNVHKRFSFDNGHQLELLVFVPFDKRTFEMASDTMKKKILKIIKIIVTVLKTTIDKLEHAENIDKVTSFDISGINVLRDFLPAETIKAVAPLKKLLGDRYHQLNSREVNKTIKTREDMKNHGEKIEQVLAAMTKL